MLTTHAREDALTDRVGANLTCEINLNSRVYSHHLGVLTDILWVVCPCHVADNNVAVTIEVVVETLATEAETCYRLTWVYLLQRVVDDTLLDEGHHAICHRLSVETEVLVTLECVEHSVGNTTYTNLKCCTVRNLASDVVTDSALHLVGHHGRHLNKRLITAHHSVNLRHVDYGVTECARHVLIDLRNDYL